jgi:RNase P/RNase MRP subunit p29
MENLRCPTSLVERIPRKHPRFPLVARVENMAGGKSMTGRTGDISVGGILVLSRDTLEPKSEVRVRFDLPSGRRVDVQGEVVHSTPGVRMGIKFLALNHDDQEAIAEYAEQVKPYKRRSVRLPRNFAVSLRWQDLDGNWHEQLAETVLITKHGGMIMTPARLKPGADTIVSWPEAGREAEARIVFRQLRGADSLSELGFEFLSSENFWGIEFPTDTPLWDMLTR